jgi:hypothetical protein
MLNIQINGVTLRNEIAEWYIQICFSSCSTAYDRSSHYSFVFMQ